MIDTQFGVRGSWVGPVDFCAHSSTILHVRAKAEYWHVASPELDTAWSEHMHATQLHLNLALGWELNYANSPYLVIMAPPDEWSYRAIGFRLRTFQPRLTLHSRPLRSPVGLSPHRMANDLLLPPLHAPTSMAGDPDTLIWTPTPGPLGAPWRDLLKTVPQASNRTTQTLTKMRIPQTARFFRYPRSKVTYVRLAEPLDKINSHLVPVDPAGHNLRALHPRPLPVTATSAMQPNQILNRGRRKIYATMLG